MSNLPNVQLHAPKPERPLSSSLSLSSSSSSSVRPPSLNQLAARININNNNSSGGGGGGASMSPISSLSSSAARPRLAASLLRTSSQTSLSTTTSSSTATNDSIIVNAPSTRSGSPTTFMSSILNVNANVNVGANANNTATPPQSTTPSIPEDAPIVIMSGTGIGTGIGTVSEPLTLENLKELNAEREKEKEKSTKVKGYKNIPSLDAITARLGLGLGGLAAKTRTFSVDGSARAPEAEMVEDPKTPGATMKAPEHPLQFTWTIYHDSKAKAPPFVHAKAGSVAGVVGTGTGTGTGTTEDGSTPYLPPPESEDYEASLTLIGEFNTVESFCRYFKWLKPPSKLELNSNYHIFKSGIKPMWEDAANCNGGKWVLTMKNNPGLLDVCWQYVAMALVGEELEEDDEICGAVVSLRSKVDRIQVWTRSREDVERLNGLGRGLMRLLNISESDNVGLEFQYNINDRPPPNKFLSIQPSPPSTSRSGIREHGNNNNNNNNKGSFGGSVGSPMSDGGTPTSGGFGSFGVNVGMGIGTGLGVGAGVGMGMGSPGWRGKRM